MALYGFERERHQSEAIRIKFSRVRKRVFFPWRWPVLALPKKKTTHYTLAIADPRKKHVAVLNEVRKRVGNLRKNKRRVPGKRISSIARSVAQAHGLAGVAYKKKWVGRFAKRFNLRSRKPTNKSKPSRKQEDENKKKWHTDLRKMLSPPGPGKAFPLMQLCFSCLLNHLHRTSFLIPSYMFLDGTP